MQVQQWFKKGLKHIINIVQNGTNNTLTILEVKLIMKKFLALAIVLVMGIGIFAGCNTGAGTGSGATPQGGGVNVKIVSSFGGDDGNRGHYEEAYKAWEAATGNTVTDNSGTAHEEWKATVLADFETGSEPDVLFYFNGTDANSFIEAGKVVPLDEIIAQYPEYAANMDLNKVPASPVDGKQYALPAIGYWEGLYVNKAVLEEAGAQVPGPETSWEEFLEICQKVKDAGFTPIAASLHQVPHYWFEFAILNNGSVANHLTLPTQGSGEYTSWVNGLNDMKDLYDKGFFPENTLTATDDETFLLMATNEAAFAVDGSWKMNWFAENVVAPEDIANYTVTFVPGKGDRATTEIISGLSMGYYITRKAWEDPAKRDAAISLITALTADEVIAKMSGGYAATALKTTPAAPADANVLQQDAVKMLSSFTGSVAAVQDLVPQDLREELFSNIKNVVTGSISSEETVDKIVAGTK